MRNALIALAAAGLAILLAAWLVREPAPVKVTRPGANMEARFPLETETYKRAAREGTRWREKRGHAFSLKDRDESLPDGRWSRILAGRPKQRPQPGGCLDCHAAGGSKGAAYWELRDPKPIACLDCHPEKDAPEMRTALCVRCHREYYFAPALAYPQGRTADEIEAFYTSRGHRDWTNAETGAAVLFPQHPQFELYSQGPHARAGASCADCHMPAVRRGALRITDHNARSPLTACAACHSDDAAETRRRFEQVQRRNTALAARAEQALIDLIEEIHSAREKGATAAELAPALAFQTKAQWRAAFVLADGSKGFHAPQESARLLAEAIDYARQGQLAARRYNK